MTQTEAKKKIAELVAKYKSLSPAQVKKYNEAETCKEFLMPLFNALGWDTESKIEVSAEEHTSTKDRADYGFYLNGWPKFYLEAKKLAADLHDPKFAKQATTYSWNKGLDWAVLTDFESLIVFSAQDISEHLSHRLFFEIKCSEFLEKFDQLWWLSKEAFAQNVLNKEAEKVGKKLQKVSVTDKLSKDLNRCRELLLRSFSVWNKDKEIPDYLLEEGVQRFLDRLIFIRVAEDRELEQPTLLPMLRARGGSSNLDFFKDLVAKFRELDKIYNSNLFAPHPFEDWQEYDGKTGEVIDILHGRQGYYEYNFEAIPADILGSVYENYLGYKLSQSEKGIEVSKDSRKRKEQGIYYTPTYIVDYIVTNALKPILDKCNSIEDIQSIKVLDPACGSGSFLIRAMEMIFQKYKKYNPRADEFTKINILLNNIYGVDLDEQAVEIARLNLLISALDSRMPLPDLSDNIKTGNSLISGTNTELEKAFGKNFRDKKPFNWIEEFPRVFNRENPGFDVIIGNPPYIDSEQMSKSMTDDRAFIARKYESAKGNWDIFCIFIERALELCRQSGYQSFIVPNKLISADYATVVRKILSEQNSIISLRDYSKVKVFTISVYPIVYVARKAKPESTALLEFAEPTESGFEIDRRALLYETFSNKGEWRLQRTVENSELMQKISDPINTSSLDNFGTVLGAATVSEAYTLKNYIKDDQENSFMMVNSGTIDRFTPLWGLKKMRYLGLSLLCPTIKTDDLRKVSETRHNQAAHSKIIIANMTIRLEAMLDARGEYMAGKSTSIVIPFKSSYSLLAILNSKVINYFFTNRFEANHLQGGAIRTGPPELRRLPIPNQLQDRQPDSEITKLTKTMINLQSKLGQALENSNKWHGAKSEIERTDHQIDQLIYKLYDLTPEEIKIIESSTK